MEGSDQHLGKHKPDRGLGQGYHSNRRLTCRSVDVSLTFFFSPPPPEVDDYAPPFILGRKMEDEK